MEADGPRAATSDEDPVPDDATSVAPDEGPNTTGEGESLFDRFFTPFGELIENDPARLNRMFTDRLARSIIILVPVFALLLRCLYWGRPYIKELVLSLHVHSFAFLVILLGLGIDTAMGAAQGKGWGNAGASLWIVAYTFVALRHVHRQGRLLTGLKMVLLLLGYLVALMATMILTLVVTVVTI